MPHQLGQSQIGHLSVRLLLVGVALIGYAYQRDRYLRCWRDEVSLWSCAVSQAPYKPRPRANLANALDQAGLTEAAISQAAIAAELSELPHIHPWDIRDAEISLTRLTGIRRLNGPR